MALVVKTVLGSNFWGRSLSSLEPILLGLGCWGRCTTHFRTYFNGWICKIGMVTGGTIWILTHGHIISVVLFKGGLVSVDK